VRELLLECFFALVECGHCCPICPQEGTPVEAQIASKSPAPCISRVARQGNADLSHTTTLRLVKRGPKSIVLRFAFG
jgi:hypothetical protein